MRTFVLGILAFISISGFSQEPLLTDNVGTKVCIGFPGITAAQLSQVQTEFAKYDHIVSARYVFGNYKEMAISFDPNNFHFHTYYDLLKVISPYYDVDKCYFDEDAAYNILINQTTENFFQVK